MGEEYNNLKKVFHKLHNKLEKGIKEDDLTNFVKSNKNYFDVNAKTYLEDILYKSGTVERTNEGLIRKVA